MSTPPPSNPPAGFYDQDGRQRWWDGTQWTDHYQSAATPPPAQPAQPVNPVGPMSSASLNVKREVVYTRQQKGHSVTAWVFISFFTGGIGLIWVIYYSVSPNHFWHA